MTNRKFLIIALITAYLVILIVGLVIYYTIIRPVEGADLTNAIVGILGWSATIYAPIAAIFLLHNWREQVAHERALDALTTAYTLIGKIHSSTMKLKMDSYFTQLQRSFRYMNQIEFNDYINRLRADFENKSNFLNEQYDSLNTSLAIYKLIKPDSNVDLEFILDSYFKISYKMIEIYNDIFTMYLTAKLDNKNYESLLANPLYKARAMQIRKKNHPDDGRNPDGSYLFFTTEYLLDIRDKSKLIMQDAIKNL